MSRTVNKLPLLGHPQIELRGIWNFSLVTLKKSVILGLSSFQFMAMARRGLFYTFLALYLRVVLGLSVTATTLLASLSMIANSASQTFIWGKISDKYQARTILVVIGEIIAAFGYVFVYFLHINLLNTSGSITAAYSIIAGLTFLEFFWSMSNLGWSALISDLTTSEERGKLMGVVSSIGGVGRIAGISVSGLLYDWGGEAAGFRNGSLFFFASGIMIVSAIVIWLSVHPSEQECKKGKPIVSTASSKDATISHNDASGTFYWFLASIFIIGLGAYSILQILVFYIELDSPIGATPFDIAMIRNSASIATIIASLVAGPLANRVGRKNALGVGLVLTVITPLLYVCAQDAAQMIVINSLSGVSMALIGVVGYLVASDLIPAERRGALFGRYNATTYISFGVAGTIIGGPIADHLIDAGFTKAAAYAATFQVASVISLAGLIVYATKVKTKVKPEEKHKQNPLM
jgi:MFS family permease